MRITRNYLNALCLLKTRNVATVLKNWKLQQKLTSEWRLSNVSFLQSRRCRSQGLLVLIFLVKRLGYPLPSAEVFFKHVTIFICVFKGNLHTLKLADLRDATIHFTTLGSTSRYLWYCEKPHTPKRDNLNEVCFIGWKIVFCQVVVLFIKIIL